MSLQKQKIATTALAVSFFGAAATFSAGGFVGSVLHHGFLASLIGGLADWFAVVALFRKPLGISYRSEILKRNKQRIMNEIVDFIVNDVLSGENIMRVLKKEDMANLLAVYLRDRGGKNRITVASSEILSVWLSNMDTEKIAKDIAPSVKEGLLALFEREKAEKILDLFAENAKRTLTVLADIGENVLNLESVQKELKDKIKEALESYAKDSVGRSMLMGFLNLDEDTVFEKIKEEFMSKINSIKTGEGEDFEVAKSKLQERIAGLKNSDNLDAKLVKIKKYAEENLLMEDELDEFLKARAADNNFKTSFENFISDKLDEFEKNKKWQRLFDMWIKNFIKDSIRKNHDLIEKMVRERLDEFTEDEFSDFVEGKVSDDLQMIRVNGAIVGGVCGMVLYIVIYAAERAFGV